MNQQQGNSMNVGVSGSATSGQERGGHMPQAYVQDGDEIDFREIFQEFWSYRKVIMATVVSTTIASGLYAFLTPKHYKADTLISPVDTAAARGKSNVLSGQLGGLANLAGLPVTSDSDKEVAIATLSSRVLIEGMIKDESLLPILFERRWDADKNKWKSDDPDDMPTLLEGYTLFHKRIAQVEEDKKKGLVTLTVDWTNQALAAHWANELVKRTNDLLRQRALEESEHNLAYLEEQAQKTSIVELKQAIYGLMEGELKKAMVAKGNDQYAFKVVDPAVVPERKSSPKRALLLLVGFLGGTILAILGVLVHSKLAVMREEGADHV